MVHEQPTTTSSMEEWTEWMFDMYRAHRAYPKSYDLREGRYDAGQWNFMQQRDRRMPKR